MGTTGHHGAHECPALGSAGVCSELCLCAAVVAHRIERNPDWKVFLNMAAAAGALIHVRSAPQALARAGGGRQEERPGQVRNVTRRANLLSLASFFATLYRGGGYQATLSRSEGAPAAALCAGDSLWVGCGFNSVPDQAAPCLWSCAGVRRVWVAGALGSRAALASNCTVTARRSSI